MHRPVRSSLLAGLLALSLFGAACGSGSSDTQASTQKDKTAQEGRVKKPTTTTAVEEAPVEETTTAPAETPTTAAPTVTTAKPVIKPQTVATVKPAVTTTTAAKPAEKVTLKLGYFPNVTHAPAIAGVEKEFFAQKLGPNVDLKLATFNAGPAVIEAMFANAIDASFIGPNPSINGFVKSNGDALRIIGGATSGGASLVVKPNINSAADLKGLKVATPQLGNTQDVALRAWLRANGLESDTAGGGDVKIIPQENAQTLEQFKSNAVQGAWVPEPWATRIVQQAGGRVLLDERDLWPDRRFVTTQLIVSNKFLKAHPETVEKLVAGLIASVEYINDNKVEAQQIVNAGIAKITGQALPLEVVTASWEKMDFTYDPIASSLKKSAEDAKDAGLLDKAANIDGIYDLSILNKLLTAAGKPTVKD